MTKTKQKTEEIETIDETSIIVKYLYDKGIEAFAEVPKERASAFVSVERTSGSIQNQTIQKAMFAINCWGETRARSANFAKRVIELLQDADELNEVFDVKITSINNNPDPDSGQARTLVVCEIIFN